MADGQSGQWYLSNVGECVPEGDRLAGVMEVVSRVLGKLGYPRFSSPKSKRMFSDHWKMGMLVIKEVLDISYRDLCTILPSISGVMRDAVGIPHHSTLRKYTKRLPEGLLDRVIGELGAILTGPDAVLAVDATGYSLSNASRHYVKRLTQMGSKETVVRDFAKVSLAADTGSKAILACDVSTSHTGDVRRFLPVLGAVRDTGVHVSAVLADKGYDAEYAHEGARDILGKDVRTWIPARECEPKSAKSAGRCRPKGRHRASMSVSLDRATYAMRSIVETVNSMIKRKMGDAARGKSLDTVTIEIKMTAVAHNIRLLFDYGLVRL